MKANVFRAGLLHRLRAATLAVAALAVLGGCVNNRLGDRTGICACSCTRDDVNYISHNTWICISASDPEGTAERRCVSQCQIETGFGACRVDSVTPYSFESCAAPSALRSSPLLATEAGNAIHGTLSLTESYTNVNAGNEGSGPAQLVAGELYLVPSGEPHTAGGVTVTLLTVDAVNFLVGSHHVAAISVLNNGHMSGSINAADEFELPAGSINGWGTVDGVYVSRELPASGVQHGYIDYDLGRMVFDGAWAAEDISIGFHLVFYFGPNDLPPQARITTEPGPNPPGCANVIIGPRLSASTPTTSGCGNLIVGSDTSTDTGGPGISRVFWYRNFLGPNPVLRSAESSIRINPGLEGRNTLTLVVESDDGQWDTASICFHPLGCLH